MAIPECENHPGHAADFWAHYPPPASTVPLCGRCAQAVEALGVPVAPITETVR